MSSEISRLWRRAAALSLAAAAVLPATAAAGPVATSDGAYAVLGRVMPDPQGRCSSGPCSPLAQGNVPATTFLGYQELVSALKYLNAGSSNSKVWQRYMEVWTLDGKLGENTGDAAKTAGTDETKNFDGNNLGFWEFTPDAKAHSAGLPTPDTGRTKSDVIVVRVTDENVPDAGKQRMALSLSIHGIERAGIEGGARAIEDLVTAATTAKLDKPILTTKGLGMPIPTFKDVLQRTIIYFTFPNPDGWRRGDVNDSERGPGVFFQRYNGNGVDLNRDFPDIGFSFRPYSGLSEPESRGWAGAFKQISQRGGPFSAGDDLHGMLGADSFSYTLLPHGSHDYAKNERLRMAAQAINLVQQSALSWSPIIQANDQPRGSCNNKPVVGADCYPMYGQSWGTVYDTINYTTTGALGDFMDSSIGLNADGIDNEMAYSHLDKDIAFEPVIEQMHVDGNKGLIYAHLTQLLSGGRFVFPARGRKGYVPNARITRAERPGTISAPPGTRAQDAIDRTVQTSGDETFDFDVKQSAEIYNGGMRIDVTSQNVQGIDPTAATGKTLVVECKGCDRHRGPADPDDKGWIVVASDYNQSGIYAQAGLTVAVNNPQPSGGSTATQWRAKVTGAPPGQMQLHVEFSQGPATTDGNTGGDAPPRLAGYDVASSDFWKKLAPFTASGAGFEPVDPGALATTDAQVPPQLDTLVLTDQPLPGYVFGPLAGVDVPADAKFASKQPTAPCGYTDGSPHTPGCYETFDFDVPKDLGRVTVTLTPKSGDLTLTVYRVLPDGTEEAVGPTSDQGGNGGTETVDAAYPAPGKYRAYVDNWVAPTDSSWTSVVHYEPPSIGDTSGKSAYSDAQWRAYVSKLRTFVANGGNLVLTDGALQALPGLFSGIQRKDVTRNISYVGQVAFTTKATTSQDAPTAGNTLGDPLARNVARPGARFNSGLRRQTYEPTPIGYAIQDATGGDASNSPQWLVNRSAFEAAGGRIAATGTSGEADLVSQVTVGEIPLGKGVVRIAGALLPQPSEAFDHQEGLEPFATTYTGYTLAENLTDWCAPSHSCPSPRKALPPVESVSSSSGPRACVAARGFRRVAATRRGRGLRFSFSRAGRAPVHVDLFQVAKGRRVLTERLIARFVTRRALVWNGIRARKRPTDGIYFARFRVKAPNGLVETRRITLRRARGRWTRLPAFYRTERCGLLQSFKLLRPAWGGSNRQPLGIAALLGNSGRLVVTVSRGKRTVMRRTLRTARRGRMYRWRLAAGRRPAGLYRVRVVARSGKRVVRATLYSRKL